MKIKKKEQKVLHFNPTKTYKYSRRFDIVRLSLFDKIIKDIKTKYLSILLSFFSLKVGGEGKIKLIGTILFILLLFGSFYYYIAKTIESFIFKPALEYKPFSIQIKDVGVAYTGTGKKVAYILASVFPIEGVEKIQVFSSDYPLPKVIYVVRPEIETLTYKAFFSALKSQEEKHGFTFSEVSIEDVYNLPEYSYVIIPRDYIDEVFVFGKPNLFELIEKKKYSVIYIGNYFDKVKISGGGLKTVGKLPKEVPMAQQPYFETSLKMNYPSYILKGAQIIYGVISVLKLGEGYLITVPQTLLTLKPGWETPKDAADDVLTILSQHLWLKIYTKDVKTGSILEQMPLHKFVGIIAENPNVKKVEEREIEENVPFVAMAASPTEVFVPYHYTNLENAFVFDLRGKGEDLLKVEIISALGEKVKSEALSSTPISLSATPQYWVKLELEKGNYLMRLVGERGWIYSKLFLPIRDIDIDFSENDEGISLKFSTANYSTEVKNVSIEIFKNGKLLFSKVYRRVKKINLSAEEIVGSKRFDYGRYVVRVSIGKTVKIFEFTKEVRNPFAGQWGLFLSIVLSGVVAFGAVYIKKFLEKPTYRILIPDFPVLEEEEVSISEKDFLETFDWVNKTYRWERYPLTLEEIKFGLRSRFKVLEDAGINDYALELELERLKSEGKIVEVADYYMPSSWLVEKSAKLLAMRRILTEKCILNAVPYEEIDFSSFLLKAKGYVRYVYLVDEVNSVKIEEIKEKFEKYYKRGEKHYFVVFTEQDAQRFLDFIYGNVALTSIKMAFIVDDVKIVTVREMDKIFVM